jgi:hypothetical protein
VEFIAVAKSMGLDPKTLLGTVMDVLGEPIHF